LEKETGLVERFVAATRSGWQAFLHGDPTPAFEDIQKRNPQMTRAAMEFARNSLINGGIIESGDAVAHGIGAAHGSPEQALAVFELLDDRACQSGTVISGP
jgi:NitT/TauT family transport system substrate-binding protein